MSKQKRQKKANNNRTPMRMCAACRARHPKVEMFRIVKTPNGGLAIDEGGKLTGRGINICPRAECLERSFEMNVFNRSWPGSQQITDVPAMSAQMTELIGRRNFRSDARTVVVRIAKDEAESYIGHKLTRLKE